MVQDRAIPTCGLSATAELLVLGTMSGTWALPKTTLPLRVLGVVKF